ncbi:hypothetical protein HZB60_06090 [candidate division KSB1 bacterium]|nr:hypothetical protein [candidate division KSB1 bacterium]
MQDKIRTGPRKVKLIVWLACAGIVGSTIGIHEVQAAFESDVTGPVSAGYGGAGIAETSDGWAGFRNPAACAVGQGGFACSWSRDFGLPELSRGAVATRQTIVAIPVSLQATSFGWAVYRESGLGVAVAQRFGDRLYAGVEAGGRFLAIEQYGSGSALAFSAGVLSTLSEEIAIAAVWRNANRGRISGFRDRLAESLALGIRATPAAHSRALIDVVQDRGFPAEVRFGAEIAPLSDLALRVGARTEPVRPSAGLTVSMRRWSFHYAGDLHPDLGASHQVGLEFRR